MANIETKGGTASPWILAGVYKREGASLTNDVHQLLVVTRSATTEAKSTSYVLKIHPDGKRTYVSSLWRKDPSPFYELEYRGLRYSMTVTADSAVIAPTGGTPPYLNRGSGNSIAAI